MQNKKWAFWLEIAEKMIRELTKMDVYSDKWFDKQRERSEEKSGLGIMQSGHFKVQSVFKIFLGEASSCFI